MKAVCLVSVSSTCSICFCHVCGQSVSFVTARAGCSTLILSGGRCWNWWCRSTCLKRLSGCCIVPLVQFFLFFHVLHVLYETSVWSSLFCSSCRFCISSFLNTCSSRILQSIRHFLTIFEIDPKSGLWENWNIDRKAEIVWILCLESD